MRRKISMLMGFLVVTLLAGCLPASKVRCDISLMESACAEVLMDGRVLTVVRDSTDIDDVIVLIPEGVDRLEFTSSSRTMTLQISGDLKEIMVTNKSDAEIAVDAFGAPSLSSLTLDGHAFTFATDTLNLASLIVKSDSWEWFLSTQGPPVVDTVAEVSSKPQDCTAQVRIGDTWPPSDGFRELLSLCLDVSSIGTSRLQVITDQDLSQNDIQDEFPLAGSVSVGEDDS